MNRRSALAGLGAVGLAGLSGCLGLIGMDSHESSPAGVEATTRNETGYEQTAVKELSVEKDAPGGPITGKISVGNYMTKHEKAVDIPLVGRQRGAVFNVLTTPKVTLLGKQFNPVEDMTTKELIGLVENNYNGIDNISHDGDSDVTILDQSTTQSQFTADAKFDGQSVTVNFHITKAVEAAGDLLVTIGVYPEQLQSQEKPNVTALAEAVSSDVDKNASSNGSSDGGDEGDSDSGSTDGNESDDGVLN
ncbi:DUF6517 family protein [Natrinema halophilum]|uniref:Uncharacterized protein n=1 Tax=Natrinema halophilum TaxID=1699371 RepID=A0A7D5GI99_9EURY|nr:DUF6517 family protein [Natrinema halophilum]QLG47470.1 DUF6517 family protein [Natrinema halophilum]